MEASFFAHIYNMDNKTYMKMTNSEINKLIPSIAVPASLSLVINSLYGVFDMYFVSKLGTSGTAAVGVAFAITALVQAIGFTIGMGSATLISAYLGEKKEKEAGKVGSIALLAGIISGVLFAVFGNINIEPLLGLLGGTRTSIEAGMWYSRIILITAPIAIGVFILNNMLRAEGRTSYATMIILSGGFLNIVLDPVFIFVFHMGVTGAGASFLVSQLYSFLGMFLLYIKGKTKVKLKLIKTWQDIKIFLEILKNGMPGFFRQGLASVAAVFISRSASEYGDEAIAGMAVSGKLYMVAFGIIIGIGQALQTTTGFCYGQTNKKRIGEAYSFCIVRGVAIMLVVGLINYILAPDIINIFSSGRKETFEIGVDALRYQSLVYPFMVLPVMCNMVYQGMRKSVKSTLVASLRQGIFFVPILYIMTYMFGIKGLIISQPLSDIFTFLVILPIFLTGGPEKIRQKQYQK